MSEHQVIYSSLRKIEKRAEIPMIGVCLYEAAALLFRSKHTPPISVLMHRYKWAFPLFCGILGLHVWFYDG